MQISVASICLDGREHDLVSFTDISHRKQVETDLEESRETFSAIVECSLDGIVILSMHGQILFINSAAARFYAEAKEDLIGRPFGCFVAIGEPMEMLFPPQSDSQVMVEMRVADSRWKGEPALVATLRDITERKKLEDSIRHMATHDELTGLANRNLLPLQMKSILALARRKGTRVAVLFIDLDNFKPINDNFGHAVGDLVLKETAQRLISALEPPIWSLGSVGMNLSLFCRKYQVRVLLSWPRKGLSNRSVSGLYWMVSPVNLEPVSGSASFQMMRIYRTI